MLVAFILFVSVVSLLVFVHELGHFLTARRLKVGVEEFGFGFPPRMFGFKRKGTIYSINWIPFGGFVRLKGEAPGSQQEPDSFSAQTRTRRFAILAAGVAMNYALAFILLTIGFTFGIPTGVDPASPQAQRVKNITPQVVVIEPNGPAATAGLELGDTVLRAENTPINSSDDLRRFEEGHGPNPFSLTIIRHGVEQTVSITPVTIDAQPRIGVGIISVGTISYPFPESIWRGFEATVNTTGQVFSSFGRLLRDLVIERKVSEDLSGPVGIVSLTGQAYRLGWSYLVQFVALLSTTLAVVNFFPLPALDGGRALFVMIEAIRRKAVDQKIEGLVHAIGFYFLIALVVLVSIRDVQRLGLSSKLAESLRQLFGG